MKQSFRNLFRLSLLYRPVSAIFVAPYLRIPFNLRALSSAADLRSNIPFNKFTMARAHRITEDLERPALDDRSYRVIELPNQLEALLVHDPDTDKASASLNVNVGSFSDEDDMPGMAHAVEHLLFMGTEKVRDFPCVFLDPSISGYT